MIFLFYQLFRSLKEELGLEKAKALFPEYDSLPDKMSKEEKAELARVIMKRLDENLDKDVVISIRRKHPCGIPKETKKDIVQIKNSMENDQERIEAFVRSLNGSYLQLSDYKYKIVWGIKKCVCGMFRNLENYEPISKTWCQCCNEHNRLLFKELLGKEVRSELIGGICCGQQECSFEITTQL